MPVIVPGRVRGPCASPSSRWAGTRCCVARIGPSLAAQFGNMASAAPALARIARRYRLVVTHGNGPQVGHILLRSELAGEEAYPLTLDAAVAQSEGETGYLVQQVLQNRLRRPVVSLTTQVVVSPRDPAFRRPTKPVGPFVDARGAAALRRRGAQVIRVDDAWRRVVASPKPREVVEADAVRALLERGVVVVAAGGGGVPVVRRRGALHGVDAVVDKDLASACLAKSLGAAALFLLTDVAGVFSGFGSPRARLLHTLRAADARRLLRSGELPAGSMGPKVEAALDFLAANPRGVARIGRLDAPFGGTRIVA